MSDTSTIESLTSMQSYDIVICGLGVSSCLLLRAMARSGILDQYSILVIEPSRTHIGKTLCFWADPDDQIVVCNRDVIVRSWDCVQVPPFVSESINPHQYYQIESQGLYDAAFNLCAENSIEIRTTFVDQVLQGSDSVLVQTRNGMVSARKVFDGRYKSVQGTSDRQTLYQSFFGLFIQISEPRFHEDSLTLMDFEIPQDGATQFMYVLPEGKHHALVECTRFGTDLIDIDKAVQHIRKYVEHRWGTFTVVNQEEGVIPMALPSYPMSNIQGHVQIGTRGGAVKPSTGYAFQTMFEHAERITQNFHIDVRIHQTKRFVFYDTLLLDILIHKSHLGMMIFLELFRTQKISMVFKFLQQKTSIWEEMLIFYRLPWGPFLISAFRECVGRLFYDNNVRLLFGTAVLTGLYAIFPTYTYLIGGLLLAISMFAVGVPHGALDYHTVGNTGVSRWDVRFHMKYWSLIVLMGMLWFLSPSVGLCSFVATSAWHFGQTDFQHWNIQSNGPYGKLLWGVSVLILIIVSHYEESVHVLELLNIPVASEFASFVPLVLCMVALVQMGLVFVTRSLAMCISLCTITVTTLLPLPLAFGIYFVGQHSVQAWSHLRNSVNISDREMWLDALPLTLGALFLTLVFMFDIWTKEIQLEWFIIMGSCITFPHIVYMDSFYRRKYIQS